LTFAIQNIEALCLIRHSVYNGEFKMSNSPSQSSQPQNAYVQVVDGDGNFCADEKELIKIIQTAQRKMQTTIGQNVNEIPYSIISIMGCQSTGL